MTNWIFLTDSDRPTDSIKVGRKALGADSNAVRITADQGPSAVFIADVKDDRGFSSAGMKSKVYHHPNVAPFFQSESSGEGYTIDSAARIQDLEIADSITIRPIQGTLKQIRSFLASNDFLVREGFTEAIPSRNLEFEAVDVSGERRTVRVDDSTEIVEVKQETPTNTAKGEPEEDEEPDIDELIEVSEPRKSLEEDAVGLDHLQPTVRTLGRLQHPEMRESIKQTYDLNSGTGLLLYGPPGCGKTLGAEGIAYGLAYRCLECGEYDCTQHNATIKDVHGSVKFFKVKGDAISDKYVGEAPSKLSKVIDHAYEVAEEHFVVLFIDEAESLIYDRSKAKQSQKSELTRTFLRKVDTDMLKGKNILLIGATNYPYDLDIAAFDRFTIKKLIQPPADPEDYAEIFRLETKGSPIGLDYEQLGEESMGFAPRELVQLRRKCGIQKAGSPEIDPRDPDPLTTEDYVEFLGDHEPETVDRYVSNVMDHADELDGFSDLKDFCIEWQTTNSEESAE